MIYEEVANSSAPKLANLPAPLTTPSSADPGPSRGRTRTEQLSLACPINPDRTWLEQDSASGCWLQGHF